MIEPHTYDCVIIGGGLAGLCAALLLADSDKNVLVLEKKSYPFHKVCGEYISNESIPFLSSLGLDLTEKSLPTIQYLFTSSPSGIGIQRPLSIGGVGWSRYALELQLYELATERGVEILTNTEAKDIEFNNGKFEVQTNNHQFFAKTAIGAFGKTSKIDVKLDRKFKAKKGKDLFIAVKHHIKADYDRSRVEMHVFPGGYCGLSAIEDNKVNLSYICTAQKLKQAGSIANLEKEVLSTNPHLKRYFEHAEFVFKKPLTIAHLQFEIKAPVHAQIMMLGDAAGNIAPLSGNGMSIAMLSAKIAAQEIIDHLNGSSTFQEMLENYTTKYTATFTKRIKVAKFINRTFLIKPRITNFGFRLLKLFPPVIDKMSKQIHGKPFS